MTPEQFHAAARRTMLSKNSRRIAYQHLVNGEKQAQLARDNNVSRNCISKYVKSIKKAHSRVLEDRMRQWL